MWTTGDGDRYEGMFIDGVSNGHGKYIWPNGRSYEGEWVNDMRHGFGKETYANGDKYIGHYWYNARQGKNETYIFIEPIGGTVKYIGTWWNDDPIGIHIEMKYGKTERVCIIVDEFGGWIIEYLFSYCSS